MTMTETKATIYFRGELMGNVHKMEVRSFGVKTGAYAQYTSAITCKFVKKGGRSVLGFVQTFQPSLLILEGWGHPDPAGIWGDEKTANGVTTRAGRHSACSPEWAKEFDSMIAEHIKGGAKVLHDFRGHNPHGAVSTLSVTAVAAA